MAAGWANLDGETFQLDTVLPEQYHHQVAERTPEQYLQEAVLKDAVRRFRKGSRLATEWFAGLRGHDGFTFPDICESLGIPQDTFLRLLRERTPRDEG